MDLDSIVERLKASVPALREIGGSATLDAAVKANRFAQPAAYVLPRKESGAENEIGPNGYSQLVKTSFSVVLVVKNVGDARGKKAHGDLQEVRGAVQQALINWKPEWAANPVEFDSGVLAEMDAGVIWWEDVYRTEFYLEA